jgi:hypothetical protein
MELKLVYRVLRKISDWSVGGFYSEVHVEGQENVRRDGPLIMYADPLYLGILFISCSLFAVRMAWNSSFDC